jgi:hypothetical protein
LAYSDAVFIASIRCWPVVAPSVISTMYLTTSSSSKSAGRLRYSSSMIPASARSPNSSRDEGFSSATPYFIPMWVAVPSCSLMLLMK